MGWPAIADWCAGPDALVVAVEQRPAGEVYRVQPRCDGTPVGDTIIVRPRHRVAP